MAWTKKDRLVAVVRPEKFESPNPVPFFSGTRLVSRQAARVVKRLRASGCKFSSSGLRREREEG
jgi:hypothetical protein